VEDQLKKKIPDKYYVGTAKLPCEMGPYHSKEAALKYIQARKEILKEDISELNVYLSTTTKVA
jgi:hypothetical protein